MVTPFAEGVGIALNALRANKVRAALTILGIAVGVAAVMIIAAMITGINRQVTDMLEQAGPRTFFVFRYFRGGLQISDGSEEMSPWRRMPPLTTSEARQIASLPGVRFVAYGEHADAAVEVGTERLSSVRVGGFNHAWPQASGGDVFSGRSFTALEDAAGARVAVAHTALAERLFGTRNAVGHRLKIAGLPYEIGGVYAPPAELFGEDDALAVTIPYAAFAKHVPHTRGWLEFRVAPAASRTVQEAIDEVTGALRSLRGLRPADENTFAVVTQDKLLETFHRVTGAFFVVMIALSSVALLVGGVGVVAIMMIPSPSAPVRSVCARHLGRRGERSSGSSSSRRRPSRWWVPRPGWSSEG